MSEAGDAQGIREEAQELMVLLVTGQPMMAQPPVHLRNLLGEISAAVQAEVADALALLSHPISQQNLACSSSSLLMFNILLPQVTYSHLHHTWPQDNHSS